MIKKENLDSNAVATINIQDSAITGPKVADAAITPAKIQYDRVPFPHQQLSGFIMPAGGVAGPAFISTGGILEGLLLGGLAFANANDADGRNVQITSGIGANAGHLSNTFTEARMGWNPIIHCRFKLPDIATRRFWVGLFSASPMALDLPGVGGISYIGVRSSTTPVGVLQNFVAMSGDGVADTVAQFGAGIPLDALIHDLTIAVSLAGTHVAFTLDGVTTMINTTLPAVGLDIGYCRNALDLGLLGVRLQLYSDSIVENIY